MPCYGETTCTLCKVGVYDNDDVCSMQQLVGAVYIGADVNDAVLNIRKHEGGYMGAWADDSRTYLYDIVHERCWKIALVNKDIILRTTRRDKLHNALRLMISAFGKNGVCPKDGSFYKHPDILKLESSSHCYNAHDRSVRYFVKPFNEIRLHMGQVCDYSKVDVPDEAMVQRLLDTMLSARDWSKDVIFSEWGCPFCIEMHTKEEMRIIDTMPTGSYVSNQMYKFPNMNRVDVEKEYRVLKESCDKAYEEASNKRHQLWKRLVNTFYGTMDDETKAYYEEYYANSQ